MRVDGTPVGVEEGTNVGITVGDTDEVNNVGDIDGKSEGGDEVTNVGDTDGRSERVEEGTNVGITVGDTDGRDNVGDIDGKSGGGDDGTNVGDNDGRPISLGTASRTCTRATRIATKSAAFAMSSLK